ncbi:MAG: hypothetical protein CMLOHMNK_02153 [Steroidobacteraceae bacterium]|nr:hypothetical protein [Steroidobacteraceae bacterium]
MHQIARGEFDGADTLEGAVRASAVRESGRQARERIVQVAGAMAGAHLEVAARQQEEHEHADGIEIDFRPAAQRLDDARAIDECDRDRDGHIDAEAARTQRAQCAREERARRIKDNRRRDEEADPAQQIARGRIDAVEGPEVKPARIHHRLHRAEACDHELLERGAMLAPSRVVERGGIERQRRVARAGQRSENLRQRTHAILPGDTCASRGGVDLHVDDTGHVADGALDQPHAGGAAYALDQEYRFVPTVAEIAQHMTGEFRPCPRTGQIRGLPRRGCARRRAASQPVVVREAEPFDPFGRRAAALAADGMILAGDPRERRAVCRQRFPAVPAAAHRRVHCGASGAASTGSARPAGILSTVLPEVGSCASS